MTCKCFGHFRASIFKKQIMGITGLMLCGFLLVHLTGNMLIYKGAEAFNHYAYMLEQSPITVPAELILVVLFMTHILLGIALTKENKKARPDKYFMKKNTGRGASFASSTMPYTGALTLIFLVFHIWHFKFTGMDIVTTYDGVSMRDFYTQLLHYFANPLAVVWYVFAVMSLSVHVSHGFSSAFLSIGFNHPKYTPIISCLAKVYALIILFGFSSFPIYFYLQGGH